MCWSSNGASEVRRTVIKVTLNMALFLWLFPKLLICWDFSTEPYLGFAYMSVSPKTGTLSSELIFLISKKTWRSYLLGRGSSLIIVHCRHEWERRLSQMVGSVEGQIRDKQPLSQEPFFQFHSDLNTVSNKSVQSLLVRMMKVRFSAELQKHDKVSFPVG